MRILAVTAVAGLLCITPCLAEGVRVDAIPAEPGADGATRLGGSKAGSGFKTYNLVRTPAPTSRASQAPAPKTRAPRNAPVRPYEYDISQNYKPPQLGAGFHDGIAGIGQGVGMMLFGTPSGKPKPQRQAKQARQPAPNADQSMQQFITVAPLMMGVIGGTRPSWARAW